MSEKRGYPNPNYTDEDIMSDTLEVKEAITIDETVVISPDKFEKLCAKAAALDILTAAISRTGEVKPEIVWAVTGANVNTVIERMKKESADRLDWYWNEKQKVEKLEAKVAQLERARTELIEILKQNKIGPYSGEPCTEGEE